MKLGLSGPPGSHKTEVAEELHKALGFFPIWFDVVAEFGDAGGLEYHKAIFEERVGQEESEVTQVVYVSTASDAIAYGAQALTGQNNVEFCQECFSACPQLDCVFVLGTTPSSACVVTTTLCYFAACGFYGNAFVWQIAGNNKAEQICAIIEAEHEWLREFDALWETLEKDND